MTRGRAGEGKAWEGKGKSWEVLAISSGPNLSFHLSGAAFLIRVGPQSRIRSHSHSFSLCSDSNPDVQLHLVSRVELH